ncbi:MAG: zinc-ribbon domain-containing protein [Bacteroidales bacterium]|jgi:hypothetical protein|nr:zinc-ribbon domain-containing protein [Bacteroidales bacterium]
MRCKNCGWDNPAGNAKCEKCNAPLIGSMIDEENTQLNNEPEDFNPKSTTPGCPNCGYPIKMGDNKCPNCGYIPRMDTDDMRMDTDGESVAVPKEKKQPVVGTIIQGTNFENRSNESTRKKLIGFLVTFSLSSNGDFFPLYEGKNTVGRDPANNIVIDDNAVSGEHLVIAYYSQNKKIYFETVGLTQNGTELNGKFYPKGGDELTTMDLIKIGSTRLTFIAIPDVAFEK